MVSYRCRYRMQHNNRSIRSVARLAFQAVTGRYRWESVLAVQRKRNEAEEQSDWFQNRLYDMCYDEAGEQV